MTIDELVHHLDVSLSSAECYESKLSADGHPLMEIGGFCGLRTRHLFNNLGAIPNVRYLEVGVLHGATLLASAYENDGEYIGIDSFCQDFGGTDPAATRANIAKWGGGRTYLQERDCWTWPMEAWPPFDVFFYDGGHSVDETARAFTHFIPAMAEHYLMIVDDASWPDVNAGIKQGLATAPAKLCHHRTVGVGTENDADGYWNGLWLGVFNR